MSSLVATGCSSSDSDDEATATTVAAAAGPAVDVALADFMIMPHAFTASAGKTTFAVHNDGQSPHNFYIRDASQKIVGETKDLNPKQKEDLTIDLPAGSYEVFCEKPGHEDLGMKGTLTVS